MKNALAALTIALLVSGQGLAADRFWDMDPANQGATPSGDTAPGTWNATNTNWTLDPLGGAGTTTTWLATDTAVFAADGDATGAYTVTATGQATNGLRVEEGTITFATGAVVLNATRAVMNANTGITTDSSLRMTITAGGGFDVTGNATLKSTNAGNLGSFVDADATIALSNSATVTLDYDITSAPAASAMSILQTNSVISGTGNMAKVGRGILGIAGAHTYSGSTTIQNGELRLRNAANRLPVATALTVNSPGILNLAAGSDQRVGSLSGNGSIGLTSALLTVQGSTSTTFSGLIADQAFILATTPGSAAVGGRLTKAGASILTLTGANTYTGVTTINNGAILANNATGSATGTGGITVGASGTLGGTGAVAGAVTLNGTLAPGASIESLATGAVTFNTGSVFSYELNTSAPLASAADLLDTSVALSISTGVTLSLFQLGAGFLPGGTKLTMINYNGTWNNGTFTGFADESEFNFGGMRWRIDYNDATPGGNFLDDLDSSDAAFVTLTAIPEASSIIAFGLTGLFSAAGVWYGKRRGISLNL